MHVKQTTLRTRKIDENFGNDSDDGSSDNNSNATCNGFDYDTTMGTMSSTVAQSRGNVTEIVAYIVSLCIM